MMNLETENKELKAKLSLSKEYFRRALLMLKKSTEFFDEEIDESEEQEEKITKFISEVKRKNLV